MNMKDKQIPATFKIRRLFREIDEKIDIVPFITFAFLSEKQKEYSDNLSQFHERYGFTFREYELLESILEKQRNEDETYLSDLKSSLNALKNSQNNYIKEIYARIPENLLNDREIGKILDIFQISIDAKKLYPYTRYRVPAYVKEYDYYEFPLMKLFSRMVSSNHTPKKVYDPSCRDAQNIVELENFEEAVLCERDMDEYYHAIQNILIHELENKVTISHKEFLIDETNQSYDTIISIPYLYGRQLKLVDESDKTEKYAKYNTKNPNYIHLLNLIEHLDDEGLMVTTTTQDLLVKRDAYDIRKYLIENNLLDMVIDYDTGYRSRDITILVINNHRKTEDILFFKRSRNRLGMPSRYNLEILKSFNNREAIPKVSDIISKEEIIKNDYNLNPKRYVYQLEYESKDVKIVIKEQEEYTSKIRQLDEEIDGLLKELRKG